MADLKLFSGAGRNESVIAPEIEEKIKAVVYEYSDRVTIAAVVGVLHVVAHQIIAENGQ